MFLRHFPVLGYRRTCSGSEWTHQQAAPRLARRGPWADPAARAPHRTGRRPPPRRAAVCGLAGDDLRHVDLVVEVEVDGGRRPLRAAKPWRPNDIVADRRFTRGHGDRSLVGVLGAVGDSWSTLTRSRQRLIGDLQGNPLIRRTMPRVVNCPVFECGVAVRTTTVVKPVPATTAEIRSTSGAILQVELRGLESLPVPARNRL